MEPEFKVEGSGVDPEWLAGELSRRVEERRRAGVYSPQVEAMLADRLPSEDDRRSLPPLQELDYSATRARESWEVAAAYPVATDKKRFARGILLAKRLARLWARIAVGPIQVEQSAFNRHAATALDAVRRQALAEMAESTAEEEDLCLLVESLAGAGEDSRLAAACTEALGAPDLLTMLGPCSPGLLESLRAAGRRISIVNTGSTWEGSPGATGTRAGPLRFLSQVAESSLEALLVPELAFWLRPERLVGLARRSYLALAPGGRLAVSVHGFASGAPAPAWCHPAAVEKALELAGFVDITLIGCGPGGGAADTAPSAFVAVGRKRG